jgi:hypothetical protein
MTASTLLPYRENVAEQTLAPILARVHDRWMAEADGALDPVTDPQATFFQRWTAVRYLWDQFAERFMLEQELIQELHAFIPLEIRERLAMQMDRVNRLHQDLDRLAHQRGVARELARTTRALLEALRLWYAEIEFAAGGIRQEDTSPDVHRLLESLNGQSWFKACCIH